MNCTSSSDRKRAPIDRIRPPSESVGPVNRAVTMTYNNLDTRLPSKITLSAERTRQLARLHQILVESRGRGKGAAAKTTEIPVRLMVGNS